LAFCQSDKDATFANVSLRKPDASFFAEGLGIMTITISDNPYFNRYQWRTHTQDKPVEEMIVEPRQQAPLPVVYYEEEEYAPSNDNGSSALAAALWELESAKSMRATLQMGNVEPQKNEPSSYGNGVVPIEILRNQILQRMGLSEGDVEKMLPAERSALENRINDTALQLRMQDLQRMTY
jgi:hypothetical protein